MKEKSNMGTIIHGIFASEHLDSSGEVLDIKGMDISSLGSADSIFNFEHNSKDNPAQVVGKVTFAKKIFKKSDCSNEHEEYFWDFCKKPFVYGKGELFDHPELDHDGAKNVAALLRYDNRDKGKKSRKLISFSIEGGKMEKKGMVVTKSIARDVAITIKHCNKMCILEILDDIKDRKSLYKKEDEKYEEKLVKSNSYRDMVFEDIKKSLPSKESFKNQMDKFKDSKSFKQKEDATKAIDNLANKPMEQSPESKAKRKFTEGTQTSNWKSNNNMRKAIVAGMMGGMPDSKTGNAALAQEDLNPTLQKPFRSKAQRRFAYANEEKFGGKEGIKEWEDKTPKNIPEKVKKNINYTNKRMKKSEDNDVLSRVRLNPEHGKKIAQAYHEMQHTPNDRHTQEAYGALVSETHDQFKKLMDGGLKISRIQPGQENPYKNSKELHNDIANNNHLWYFPTDQGYGSGDDTGLDHPLLQGTGYMHDDKELLANDMFRIVHDVNGHHLGGQSGFGPTGEHRAFLTHRKMYSPLAQKALASETLGQNSWVNFGPHGEHNRANPHKTIYADQKAGLLPDEITYGDWHLDNSDIDMNNVKKNEKLEKMSRPLMTNKQLGLGQDLRMDVKTIDPEKQYNKRIKPQPGEGQASKFPRETISEADLETKKIQQQYRNKEKEIANLKPGYEFTPKAQKQIGEYQKRFKVDPETARATNIYDPDYDINRSYVYKQKDSPKNEIGPEIHEATHGFFSDVASKYGEDKSNKLSRHLLDSFFDPKDLQKIKDFVSSRYDKDYPHHQEEHITHIADVLNRPSVRKEFLNEHSNVKKLGPNPSPEDLKLAQDLDRRTYKRLASGWNNSVKYIQNSKKLSDFLKNKR